MFLVIGITGQTGGPAAQALLDSGERVRALVRDPSRAAAWAARGVELMAGAVTDSQALEAAMTGVTGAFALVPPAPAHPDPIAWSEEVASAVLDAAQRAGLARLVVLSSEAAHLPAGTGPIRGLHRAEAILAGAAGRRTFLRPSFFMQNWRGLLPVAAAQGVLPSMLTDLDGRRAMVATDDIGRTAASLLLEPEPAAIVELAGPEEYSPNEVAEVMAAALGRPAQAVVPPREGWLDTLLNAGLGRGYAELLVEMYDGINSGHVGFSGTVPLTRGRTPLARTVQRWIPTNGRLASEAA